MTRTANVTIPRRRSRRTCIVARSYSCAFWLRPDRPHRPRLGAERERPFGAAQLAVELRVSRLALVAGERREPCACRPGAAAQYRPELLVTRVGRLRLDELGARVAEAVGEQALDLLA